MDVSELRKGILRALDEARKDATARRAEQDQAAKAYAEFLHHTVVPLFRQAATVLRAEGQLFSVQTPAESVRLVSDSAPHTFVECALDATGEHPHVIGRVSVTRGRQGLVLSEAPLGDGKAVPAVDESDVSTFLLAAIPRLVLKP